MSNETINRIKVVLVEQRKTNKWLAEKLGKTQATVSRWAGNKAQPSLDKLVEIARLLKVEVKDLINKESEIKEMLDDKQWSVVMCDISWRHFLHLRTRINGSGLPGGTKG